MHRRFSKDEFMEANIVLLPGDGIGPEVVAAAVRVLEAVDRNSAHHFNFTEHLIGGCSIDAARHRPDRRNPAGLPGGRCRAAGRGGRPEMGRPDCQSPPGAGAAGAAQGSGCVCQPAPGQGLSQPGGRLAAATGKTGRGGYAGGARTDRRAVFRPAQGPRQMVDGHRARRGHPGILR